MSDNNDHEKRKFRRVQVQSLGSSLSGLTVQLIGTGPVELYDISYGGAAFSQPDHQKVSLTGETVELDFFLNGQKAQNLTGRVVRLTQDMFAVEFMDPSAETKAFVDRLITSRMVGLNMNLIDPQFYRGKESFSYWFHGPKNTNLFLWEDQGHLTKASLDLFDVALHWENGLFQIDNKMNRSVQGRQPNSSNLGEGVFRQAAEILSQMRSNVSCLEEFKQHVFDKALVK
ncbi:MAG: PilZ domain-containing protein [Bdellovibrionales bacterium]|nr:PilZ domain-containing protein [Bdellovibrionales bacterium]